MAVAMSLLWGYVDVQARAKGRGQYAAVLGGKVAGACQLQHGCTAAIHLRQAGCVPHEHGGRR
jgi:hypothetical protein